MERPPETAPREKILPAPNAPMEEKIEYFEVHPEDVRPEDLNNLSLWLPGSGYLTMLERILDKKRPPSAPDSKHSELWQNQTPREYANAVAEAMAQVPEVRETLDKLKADKERLTQELADSQDRVTKLYESLRHLPEDERRARFREEVRPIMEEQGLLHSSLGQQQSVNQGLVPVYLALRKKGYSHYDVIV